MLQIHNCFSILVASGHGHRCTELGRKVREHLLEVDRPTGKVRLLIWKFCKRSEPEAHKRIAVEVAALIGPLFCDISDAYFWPDYRKDGDAPPATSPRRTPPPADATARILERLAEHAGRVPRRLASSNRQHVYRFRRILECALRLGLWNGAVGEMS